MRSAALIASLALTGCFYVDPINQRPSLDINQEVVGTIFRKQSVKFTAIVNDPDGHGVDLVWYAYMCTDASTSASCDETAAESAIGTTFEFTVPERRIDGVTPVQGMRIVLDGIDSHGAVAKPPDQLELPVLDRSPTIEPLRATSIYIQPGPTYVVGMPIEVYAAYTDGDDPLDSLNVQWKWFAPSQVTPDVTDLPTQTDGMRRTEGKILRPQVTGQWMAEVTVTDPVGNTAVQMVTLSVVPDRAPCIASVAPAVPTTTTVLPVDEPTLFQVPIVDDDLDSYPTTPGGAEFGTATFTWTILEPNSTRRVIGTSSSTLFDPALYAPGTVVEMRVEIADRTDTPVSCADGMPTCGPPSCIQRQTWRVEAR